MRITRSPQRSPPASRGAPLAQQPIVLQWQTANLTESQYEPVWKATIAEFEAANPGDQDRAGAGRAQGPLDQVRRRRAGEEGAVHRHRSTSRPPRTTATSCRSTSTSTPSRRTSGARGATTSCRASKWKGQLYGLPIWGGTYAEIYNRDLVTKAGLDPAEAAEELGGVPRVGEEAHRQRPVGHRGARRQDRHHHARAAHVDLVQRRRSVQRRHDRGDLRQEPEEPRGDQVLSRAS